MENTSNKTMTIMSVRIMTVSVNVVMGPCAPVSSIIVRAEEGERAIINVPASRQTQNICMSFRRKDLRMIRTRGKENTNQILRRQDQT